MLSLDKAAYHYRSFEVKLSWSHKMKKRID